MILRNSSRLLTAFALVMALPMFGADTYKIDPVHSETGFRVRHLLTKVAGRFTQFAGTIQVDSVNPGNSSVDVTIDAASITTSNDARDKHLRSADFFDTAQFANLTFKSTAVKEVSKGNLEVTGTLTMHGVAKTVVIQAKNLGTMAGPKPGMVVAGFEGSLKLNRSDYGIKYGIPAVGDEVEITLNVEAGKVEPATKEPTKVQTKS
jgi:polyisoprenoid-binding protein YceI